MGFYCVHCGTAAQEGALYCTNCGAPLLFPDKTAQTSANAAKDDGRCEPMRLSSYLLLGFLFCIPIVNLILMLLWSFGKRVNPNKRNFSRFALIVFLILHLIGAALVLLFVSFVGEIRYYPTPAPFEEYYPYEQYDDYYPYEDYNYYPYGEYEDTPFDGFDFGPYDEYLHSARLEIPELTFGAASRPQAEQWSA